MYRNEQIPMAIAVKCEFDDYEYSQDTTSCKAVDDENSFIGEIKLEPSELAEHDALKTNQQEYTSTAQLETDYDATEEISIEDVKFEFENYEYFVGDDVSVVGVSATSRDDNKNLSDHPLKGKSNQNKHKRPTNTVLNTETPNPREYVSSVSRKRKSSNVPDTKRKRRKIKPSADEVFGLDHLPDYAVQKNGSRCKNCQQKKKFIRCLACNVFLCLLRVRNCYKEYHLNKFK